MLVEVNNPLQTVNSFMFPPDVIIYLLYLLIVKLSSGGTLTSHPPGHHEHGITIKK